MEAGARGGGHREVQVVQGDVREPVFSCVDCTALRVYACAGPFPGVLRRHR